MKLHEGVYENLINGQLAYDMKQTEKEGLVCKTEQIDSAESAKILADFLADAIRKKLEDKDIATEEKINFVNDILDSTDIDDNEKLIDATETRQWFDDVFLSRFQFFIFLLVDNGRK